MGYFPEFTKKQWAIVCALGCVNFANTLCFSVQAPFYPQEAEKKGLTATEYGLVFGVYELVAFVSCPIFGKYINHIGAKFMLNAGIVSTGTCAILFGMLSQVNGYAEFISLSFMIRIVESLGSSASMTASFSIAATLFPGSVSTMFATLEIFYGLGFICGPSIGGLLFELGGFMLPFAVIGGTLLLVGVIVLLVCPSINDETLVKRPQAQIWSVLKLSPVLFNVYGVVVASASMGYYDAVLEPHLRQFNLSPLEVGGVFVIIGGSYAVTSPCVGLICDSQVVNPRNLIVVGSLLTVTSVSLVGPAPFMPFDATFWVVCLGLVFSGTGYGFLLVPCFVDSLQSAIAAGLPEDISTYGIVSGLMSSAFCLGGFIGPSVAGYLFYTIGFQEGTLFVIALNCVLLLGLTCCVSMPQPPMYSLSSDQTTSYTSEMNVAVPSNTSKSVFKTADSQLVVVTRQKTYGSIFLDKNKDPIRWKRDVLFEDTS